MNKIVSVTVVLQHITIITVTKAIKHKVRNAILIVNAYTWKASLIGARKGHK